MRREITKFGEISELEPRIAGFIKGRTMYVLRDSKTGIALNTSYSEEGLRWTTNVRGRLICFKNA